MLLYIPILVFIAILQAVIWILPEWRIPTLWLGGIDYVGDLLAKLNSISPCFITIIKIIVALVVFEFVFLMAKLTIYFFNYLRGAGELKI
jgi:hypothetical protein